MAHPAGKCDCCLPVGRPAIRISLGFLRRVRLCRSGCNSGDQTSRAPPIVARPEVHRDRPPHRNGQAKKARRNDCLPVFASREAPEVEALRPARVTDHVKRHEWHKAARQTPSCSKRLRGAGADRHQTRSRKHPPQDILPQNAREANAIQCSSSAPITTCTVPQEMPVGSARGQCESGRSGIGLATTRGQFISGIISTGGPHIPARSTRHIKTLRRSINFACLLRNTGRRELP